MPDSNRIFNFLKSLLKPGIICDKPIFTSLKLAFATEKTCQPRLLFICSISVKISFHESFRKFKYCARVFCNRFYIIRRDAIARIIKPL